MLENFFALIGAALSLDRNAFVAAESNPRAYVAAFVIAFAGGLSLMLGQSVVLFANGVSRKRFALSLLGFGIVHVLGLVVWGVSIWSIGTYLSRIDIQRGTIYLSVCLGQAPLLFGFLILIPYIGSSLRRLLEAYSLVVVVAALSAMLEIRPIGALTLAAVGWALRAGLLAILQLPFAGMRARLPWSDAGKGGMVSVDELMRQVADREERAGRTEERPSAG